MSSLEGKVALVTGGKQGIGRAIVDRFRQAGTQVVTCGRGSRPDDLPEDIIWVKADLSERQDVDNLRDKIKVSFGRLDILVNNAGIQLEKTVTETTDAEWDLVMGANAKSVFLCCRSFIPLMATSGGGSIINIGSISGNAADAQMAVYNASKAFVHGLTRSIATDHGREGIRCNAICPGWIMTAMSEAGFDIARDPALAKQDALARHSVGRFGKPEDIANIALWFASEEAAYATGQTFVMDGGLTSASPLRPDFF